MTVKAMKIFTWIVVAFFAGASLKHSVFEPHSKYIGNRVRLLSRYAHFYLGLDCQR